MLFNKQKQPDKILMGNKPIFYLVYMVFYFAPWVFQTPETIDIVAAVVVVAAFVPFHFWTFRASGGYKLLAIAILELFAIVSAPFLVSFGVFHIYAAAQAGVQPTLRKSAITLALCSLVFVACGYFFGRSWVEIGFILVMAMFVWVSCMTEFEKSRRQSVLIRERELDKQQASLMERERIANDLHDLLGHTLTMVALKSEIAGKLMEQDPARAKQEVLEINQASRAALNNVRAAVSGMTSTTLKQELENAKMALSAAKVRFIVKGAVPNLSREKDKAASLAIREAVTNVIRHSNATTVTASFSLDNTNHNLIFEDNGSKITGEGGSGLAGLKGRIEKVGGTAIFDMLGGFKIAVTIPLK